MTRLKAHFDGKSFVPDEPVDIPIDTKVVLRVERDSGLPPGKSGAEMVALLDNIHIAPGDLDEMERHIEEACERIEEIDNDVR